MGQFIYRRATQAVIALFVLATLVFILARVAGDPTSLLLPSDASEEDRIAMAQRLGLDRPLYVQYVDFLGDALRGDLGESFRFKEPAVTLVLRALPNSLRLVVFGFLLATVIAIPLGVLAGSRAGGLTDQAVGLLAIIGIAAPSFWIALVLMQIFSVQLHILPVARMMGIQSFILPAISMSFFVLAGMVRLLRSTMIEVLDSEFIKLARLKGASPRTVLWKHALRNCLIPLLSFGGMYFGIMVGGVIVIETIFAWPGVGGLAANAIESRDYPLIQALVLSNGTLIIFVNFAVDVLYSYVDPRIRRD